MKTYWAESELAMGTDKLREEISGRTYVQDGRVIWKSAEGLLCQIPIKDIRIIGEYTTSGGPLSDDWFYVFITEHEEIRQVSAYAAGAEEMLIQVGNRVNAVISRQLANSATFKSNVLWPASLVGQELFQLIQKESTGIWEKIGLKIGLIHNEGLALTDALIDYLRARPNA